MAQLSKVSHLLGHRSQNVAHPAWGFEMNEQIRELAKQAGDYVNEVYTPPVRSKTPGKIWEDGHIDWHTQFNEKFAWLIVQECAQVADAERPSSLGCGYITKTTGMRIKEHFGVE